MLLVVEDEPDLTRLLRLIFDPARFTVRTASDLATARLTLARSPLPDLAIIDVILPDGSGLDLCRELKAMKPTLPVVVLTAMIATRNEALAAGANAFITKPFDPDALVAEVERLLAPPRPPPGPP